MTAFYLAAILLLLLALYWRVSAFNPISPSVVSASAFLASAILLAAGPQSLHKNLSEYTILTIILALLAFFIGELTARLSFRPPTPPQHTSAASPIEIKSWTYVLILAFSLITLVWSYHSVKEMATAVGYREGENLLIQYGRLAVLQNEMRPSIILTIFGFMLRALSYVLTFAYLYNKIISRKKIKLGALLLLPSLIYLLQYMLWGSRGGVIEYISFFIFLYAYFLSRATSSPRALNIYAFSLSLKGIGFFFLIFISAGALKGWAESNPLDIIAIYGGGSLSALDIYLRSPIHSPGAFGQETLLGIYSLIERMGFSSIPSSRILEFTPIGQTEVTNIYTSIRRYINDYGMFGMLTIQFFLGYLFSIGLIIIKKSKNIGYFSIFYATSFMALIYQALDEQALTTFLSTTQIFTVLFTFIFYRLLLHKKVNKPEKQDFQTP